MHSFYTMTLAGEMINHTLLQIWFILRITVLKVVLSFPYVIYCFPFLFFSVLTFSLGAIQSRKVENPAAIVLLALTEVATTRPDLPAPKSIQEQVWDLCVSGPCPRTLLRIQNACRGPRTGINTLLLSTGALGSFTCSGMTPHIHGTNSFTWYPSHGRHTLQC